MNTENMIDVTGCDLVAFVKKVYDLSQPRGLGFLHATTGGLSDEDAKYCIVPEGRIAVRMDYVHGRGCKMTVFREGEKLYMPYPWYDHTHSELVSLLNAIGVEPPKAEKHSCSCACDECEKNRRAAN
jgi:hypothetical protein